MRAGWRPIIALLMKNQADEKSADTICHRIPHKKSRSTMNKKPFHNQFDSLIHCNVEKENGEMGDNS